MTFATFSNYQSKKNVKKTMSFALGTNRGLLGVRSPLDEVYQCTSGSKQVPFWGTSSEYARAA